MSTSGGSGGEGNSVATTHLNAAAIATLFSAPTTLVADPGGNKAIMLVGIFGEFKGGLTGYGTVSLAAYYNAPLLANQASIGIDALLDSNQSSRVTSAGPNLQGNGSALVDPGLSVGYLRTVAQHVPLVLGSITSDPDAFAAIVTTTIGAAGTGYAAGDTGTIDGGIVNPPAAYVVDTVAAITGAVLTYHLSFAGTGYQAGGSAHATTNAGAQPGIGTGFTLNITAISPADGDLYITTFYRILSLH